MIKQSPGTIGYVEYGYATGNNLSMASIENKSGNFIAPSIKGGQETLTNVEMPANLRIWPIDPEGADDYPIVSFTWLLLYGEYPDTAKRDALLAFVKWGLTDGQQFAPELGYIPLPEDVVKKSSAALSMVR